MESKQLNWLLNSEVLEIGEDFAVILFDGLMQQIANDDVFVMAGGIPPFQLLSEAGVSFDPADRPAQSPGLAQGTGLFAALQVALCFAIAAFVWAWWFRGYYQLSLSLRPLSDLHSLLRPNGTVGLTFGVLAATLVVANLCYLIRRNWFRNLIPGQLVTWMSAHIATGILAFLFVLIHAAFAPRNTIGGHAFIALGVLVVTGAIGRYFYSFVPRATNGRELELDEIQAIVASELSEWDEAGREFHDRVLGEINDLVAAVRWQSNFFCRLIALFQTNSAIGKKLQQLKRECQEQGLTGEQAFKLTALAKRAYRSALGTAHFEDLRAILNSWRYFHRWLALLMVLLAVMHIVTAIRFAVGAS